MNKAAKVDICVETLNKQLFYEKKKLNKTQIMNAN